MVKSRFGYRTQIPTSTTRKGTTKQVTFNDGLSTYKDNDDLKPSELLYVTDSRFSRIGRYMTRKGCDRLSVPIGEAVNAQQVSTAGASTVGVSTTVFAAQKLTAASTARLTRVGVNIRNANGATGTVIVELYTDSSGPGERLARSSIGSADIGATFAYKDAYFIEAPQVTNTTAYWLVFSVQSPGLNTYEISTTTNTTAAALSANAGVSWTNQSYSLNVKLYTSTAGGVKGMYKAYRPDGTKVLFFAHGTSVYKVDETTGATTAVDTGLNSSATHYRFQMVQDALYYVNGYQKPRKYDFTTASELTDSPYNAYLTLEHKGLLFFVDAADKTRLFYTNFGVYDDFTSTDFIYVPAPKSYDSATALAKLNGVLFPFTSRNKFQLMGDDNATFILDEAAGQKGTFSQESVVWDANYIWFASDDGIYQFNGTSEENIAKPILQDYLDLPSKQNIALELYNNRLYVFYTPVGGSDNTECFVYNTLLGKWESLDTGTYIGRTFGRYAQEDIFLQGSNRVGAVYYGEKSTNDYHNLGDILRWEIRTSYSHFGTPAQLHRIPKWRLGFSSATSNYSVQVGYAVDLGEAATYQDVSLGGSGIHYDDGKLYDNGEVYSGTTNVDPKNLYIPGSYQRIQRRYKHHAARQPVEFLHEILTLETERI